MTRSWPRPPTSMVDLPLTSLAVGLMLSSMRTRNLSATAALALPGIALAAGESKFGLQTPQSTIAHQIYDLHAMVLAICIAIAVVVFGAMIYSIVRHRRSLGREAKQFQDNKALVITWTIVPILIVVGMAFPATRTVFAMKDTSGPDMRWISVPDLASGDTAQLWPGFQRSWPASGPGIDGPLSPMHATGIPLINTLILLTSAATLLWARWGLEKGARGQLKAGLALTVGLGVVFLCLQASEYYNAYNSMGLTLGSGAYGATFFMCQLH